MFLRVLYLASTAMEIEPLKRVGRLNSVNGSFRIGKTEIFPVISGVGSVFTAWALMNWFRTNGKPDIAINGGIAGSFNVDINVGDVVLPVSDCFADLGIEDGDKFLTLTETGLLKADEFPFRNGLIIADNIYIGRLKEIVRPVHAVTVNTATGSEKTREKIEKKFYPDIETMEGATFFYICHMENVPFLALRAVSNMVGIRDIKKWNVDLALDNLSEKIRTIFLTF